VKDCDKMSDWRAELSRDGVTASQKRAIFDILRGGSEITYAGIKSGLTNRGIRRFKDAKVKNFLNNSPKIRKITTVYGSVSYKLEE
jgi:hypothetical protein|tara:strand:- start:411 stop:668 length:258 start_codon:yes stop_codon:yes gene_type:complete